jgi:hypothetical protein
VWSPNLTLLGDITEDSEAWFHGWEVPSLEFPARAGLHAKCPLLLFDFNQNWNVSTDFSKTPQRQISAVLELLRGDRHGEGNRLIFKHSIESV